ncbi:MAG: NYN domain-containing protein, partial [Desulfobacterota bacterium]|nr:NYN domain-containing protein [Thermodesulfobacteriota bacterium]
MTYQAETRNMALFCDFENIALGVRDANYAQFDVGQVLERLLLKGNIVVKKAYCDWERYKEYKKSMHEASFELIEIPHVRQSGKNSADIRMVVDALDLCYTKGHVDTFVLLSGDSDFSPLVSKLRENNKIVIGVGVKNSTSDLLIANCDEFIYYDDLRKSARGTEVKAPAPPADKKQEAWDLVLQTYEALLEERGAGEKIWGSMIKQTLKR